MVKLFDPQPGPPAGEFSCKYSSLIGPLVVVDMRSLRHDSFVKHLFNCGAALQDKQFTSAHQFAVNAALEYGTPGLIMYYQANFEALRQAAQEEGEDSIQTAALNLFALLRAARMMSTGFEGATILEPGSEGVIAHFFPAYRVKNHPQKINWQGMEDELIKLGKLEGWTESTGAQSIYHGCYNDLFPPTTAKSSPETTSREPLVV